MKQAPFTAGDAPLAPLFLNRSGPACRVSSGRVRLARAGYALLVFWATTYTLTAQEPFSLSRSPFALSSESKHLKHKSQEKPAFQPDATIPVAPLGFAPPAIWYLGDRVAQVSLDFLSEDSLLFTFRIPGLVPREPVSPESKIPDQTSRNMRALVFALPSGRITAEAVWHLHDFQTYLWTLRDGRFLLRDRNLVLVGNADLRLDPFLRFPGSVRLLGLDPAQRLLVANSYELLPASVDSAHPPSQPPPSATTGALEAGLPSANISISEAAPANQNPTPSPNASAAPNSTPNPTQDTAGNPAPTGQNLLRILSMDDRSVQLFTRVATPVHLPIDGQGYYEALRGSASYWQIFYTYFTGASAPLLQVESTCNPALEVESPGIVLISACTANSGRRLVAANRNWPRDKARIWDAPTSPAAVWPLVVHAADAPRIARATLDVNHPVTASSPLDSTDIRGQTVQVYDLATGKVQLSLPLSPILDAGGNFALSPSGNRLAVLHAGAIEIYNLPPVPPIPAMPPPNPPSPKR